MHRPVLATVAVGAVLLAGGCATDPATDGLTPDDPGIGHIHGLGIDPADKTLYVATHFGLFNVDDAEKPTRVADRWQDTMAFTIVGPGHFLASGHPDLSEDLPPHLGLIESTDAGETWSPLALQGKADFHILEPASDELYAYDATTGRLLRTTDMRNFAEVLRAPLLSVAAIDAADAGRPLVATNNSGQIISIHPSTGKMRQLGGPTTVYLDTTPDGTLVGIGPDGAVRVSSDGAQTWREVGSIEGAPAAFTISDQDWYAATETTVFRSTDNGETWSRVL